MIFFILYIKNYLIQLLKRRHITLEKNKCIYCQVKVNSLSLCLYLSVSLFVCLSLSFSLIYCTDEKVEFGVTTWKTWYFQISTDYMSNTGKLFIAHLNEKCHTD